jgi:hypothetical protein
MFIFCFKIDGFIDEEFRCRGNPGHFCSRAAFEKKTGDPETVRGDIHFQTEELMCGRHSFRQTVHQEKQ